MRINIPHVASNSAQFSDQHPPRSFQLRPISRSRLLLKRVQYKKKPTEAEYGEISNPKAPGFPIPVCLQLLILTITSLSISDNDKKKPPYLAKRIIGCETESKFRALMESKEEQEKSGNLILVAIDDDEGSVNSLQWALNNLSTSHDRIILIHAQHPKKTIFAAGSPGFMIPVEVLRMLEDDAKKATEKLMAKATEICQAKSLTPKTLVQHGDAREVICNAVKKYNPDMLVLGSRGLGRLKRAVLGSVSDYCAHNVECPVVVVKPQESTVH